MIFAGPMKMTRQLTLLFLLVLSTAAVAQEWTEYRRVDLTLGDSLRLDLGDTVILVSPPSPAILSLEGRHATLRAARPQNEKLFFDRRKLGPLEIDLFVHSPTPPSAASPQPSPSPEPVVPREKEPPPPRKEESKKTPPPPPAPAVVAPVRVPPARPAAPPIATAPAPLVLQTPPWGAAPQPSAPPASREIPLPVEVEEVRENPLPPPSAIPPAAVSISTSPPSAPGEKVREKSVASGAARAPVSTPVSEELMARPEEMAIYALALDLLDRGLFSEAISEFRRLLETYPGTRLKKSALMQIGVAWKKQGEWWEKESTRRQDLRRTGLANEAIDSAIASYSEAVAAFTNAMDKKSSQEERNRVQIQIAESLHGVVRAQFVKGSSSEDSPVVVVEYLKSFVAGGDSATGAEARLGIAQYYRDLGDARHLADPKDPAEARRAYDRAVEEFERVLAIEPRSLAAEEALLDLARLFDKNLLMRKFVRAVEYYERLARDFPAGVHAEESRTRARDIRRDYL